MSVNNKRRTGRPYWYSPEDAQQIKTWLDGGLSYSEIGRRYGRQASQIKLVADRNDWKSREVLKREDPAAFAVTEKACIDCKDEKPIEHFPERYDRPGKRHTRCAECHKEVIKRRNRAYDIENFEDRAIWRKAYQAANPGYNENSSRTRRARLKKVRSESFTQAQVRERDGNNCFFCREYVDPLLQWPDPQSPVIHHVHPLAKQGPNIFKNAALAHNRCNIRSKDHYESPFANWSVGSMERTLARDVVIAQHYLHRRANISYAFALYTPNNHLAGVVTFGSPSSWRINKSICPNAPSLVIELNRLWIGDGVPFGAASWLVSRALKKLPPLLVVSYADTGAHNERNGEAHDGGVYRALSFNYAGRTRARKEWRLPGKSRNTGRIEGAILCEVTSKERFWTVTGSKRQKQKLRALVAWPV